MTIEKIEGTSQKLYALVAPLVMRRSVLRQNNNYPFYTSRSHTWLVAVEGNAAIGFIPIEISGQCAKINNYYISSDDEELLSLMLQEAIQLFGEQYTLQSVTQVRHVPVFESNGFSPVKEWKLYTKMQRGNYGR